MSFGVVYRFGLLKYEHYVHVHGILFKEHQLVIFLVVEFLEHKVCIYAVSVDTDKHLSKIVAKLSIPLPPPSTTV